MVLYAVVAIFVISKVSDGIIEGLKFSKAAFIITEKHQVISQTLMKELKRGTTGITVHGMYSGKEKNHVVLCGSEEADCLCEGNHTQVG